MQNEIQKEHVIYKKKGMQQQRKEMLKGNIEQKTNPKCKQEFLKGNIEQHEHEA